MVVKLLAHRVVLSLCSFPSSEAWFHVLGITFLTTTTAGIVATATGFIRPLQDFDPPRGQNWVKPLSAFIFPSLVEEAFWRGALLPHPTMLPQNAASKIWPWACGALLVHVLSHPLAAKTVWPRGKHVFHDYRFLILATIVLGGSTASYVVSGGSAWAAALPHGVAVALWRDFFGGESTLGLNDTKRQRVSVFEGSDD